MAKTAFYRKEVLEAGYLFLILSSNLSFDVFLKKIQTG